MSTVSGIQGHLLEVAVVGCNKLKDTEWISRQDPYVCLEYATPKQRSRTCTWNGGQNPTLQDKFVFSLIEGLRELQVTVWNSNTVKYDYFIGTGKVQLQKVLSHGYDDGTWPLQTKSGRSAREVRLIMHYDNGKDPRKGSASSAPSYHTPVPQAHLYCAPLPASYPPAYSSYPPTSPYSQHPYAPPPLQPAAYPPAPSPYPPPPPQVFPCYSPGHYYPRHYHPPY